MQNTVDRISRFFTWCFAKGSSLCMFTVFIIVFINSLRRYTFGKSLEWGEELPVFIAVYGIMFGMAYAYMEDRHIRFTILVGFLKESFTRKLFILVDLVMIATGALLTWSGWLFVLKRGGMESSGMINVAKDLRELTGLDQMLWIGHLYPYQAAMVLGGVMITIAAILKMLSRFSVSPVPVQAREEI